MYFSVRYGSPPSSDPQQAQTQKIMAFVSPAMIAFFGFKYQLGVGAVIYWLALNVFTVAQQFFMFRRYGLIGAGSAAAMPLDVTRQGRELPRSRASRRAQAAANDGSPARNGKAEAKANADANANGKQQYARRSKRRAGR